MKPSFGDIFWIVLVAVLAIGPFILLELVGPSAERVPPAIALSDVAVGVEQSRIRAIHVQGDHAVAVDILGSRHPFDLGPHINLLRAFSELGVSPEALQRVDYSVEDPPISDAFWTAIIAIAPMILLGMMFLAAVRTDGDANAQVLRLSRHRARRFVGTWPPIRFEDVAGVDEAKDELQEIVQFLLHSAAFAELGARCPRGVLLVGPPGTGKTLLARALAGEAHVPFFSVSGAEFVEIIAGVGASRIRDMFEHARRCAPCILFVDEIDAIGRRRGLGVTSGTSECEQALNQLLVEMDGFDSDSRVVVLAATNRVDILDPALLRPGRFDRQVLVAPPDRAGREAILHVHARGKPLDSSVDLGLVARMTGGLSGADLATIMNEGAILAARNGKTRIGMVEVDGAIERVLYGPPARSCVVPADGLARRAQHEAGRALVAHLLEHHPPVHKVTILSHGLTAGHMHCVELDDRTVRTRAELQAQLTATVAGPVAEQLVFADIASGSEGDIETATRLAEAMVRRYGMSRLGPVSLPSTSSACSQSTTQIVDAEIRDLIEQARAEAAAILTSNRSTLDKLATALVEAETLEGEALERALAEPAG